MKSYVPSRNTWCDLAAVSLLLLLTTACACGEEPARQFLDGLRTRGYFDMASEYLKVMHASTLLPSELKDTLLYEEGVTLVQASRAQRDVTIRAKQLDEATGKFESFIRLHSESPVIDLAQSRLREILVERARMAASRAERITDQASKSEVQQEARKLFGEARTSYQDHLGKLKTQLQEMMQQPAAERDRDRWKQLRDEYLEANFVDAITAYEIASTAKDDREEYHEMLDQASEAFAAVADKYRSRLVGIASVYYQGRCQQDMGNLEDALTFYKELLDQTDQPQAVRSLCTKATRSSLECWIDDRLKDYAQAIEVGQAWVTELNDAEANSPDGLALKLVLARANQLQANSGDAQSKSKTLATARKLATAVSRVPGPFQKQASDLLANLGSAGSDGNKAVQPKDFAAATAAAQQAREQMQSADLLIKLLQSKLAKATGEKRTELEQQVATARQKYRQHRTEAIGMYSTALDLAKSETPISALSDIRYFLGYMHYDDEDYYDAAVLCEFVARRDPGHAVARPAANVAMAAYIKLFAEADPNDREFEKAHLMSIADYIATSWPTHEEAVQAVTTMVNFLVQQGDVTRASQYVERIPASSPQRGEAELLIGQSQWNAYLRGMRARRAAQDNGNAIADLPTEEELEQLKANAQKTLAGGVQRLRQQPPNPAILRGVLALAQIYVDTNELQKAIQLLDDQRIGPRTLADQGNPLMDVPGMSEMAYQTALRAQIGLLPTAADKKATIAAATAIMDALEKHVGDSADGRDRLVAIYVRLANGLREQMAISPPSVKETLAEGFETFLDAVAKNAREFNVVNWVAETFANLGEGFDTDKGPLPPNAKKFYLRAVEMYRRILDTTETGQWDLKPGMVIQVRMRMAATLNRLGEHKKAIDMFEQILKEKNMMLNVQVEAARAFQMGGTASNDFNLLDQAVKGSRQDPTTGKMIIWGWGKISKLCQAQMFKDPDSKARFSDTFFDARYNLGVCRYEQSQLKQGGARKKYLDFTKRGITSLAGSYPELGGPAWKPKFDALLKRVQKDLEEGIRQ